MKKENIEKYLNKEVLVITKNNFTNFGLLEDVDDNATTITTPSGQMTIENDLIVLIRTKKTRWS